MNYDVYDILLIVSVLALIGLCEVYTAKLMDKEKKKKKDA